MSAVVYSIHSIGASAAPVLPDYVVTIDDFWLTFLVATVLPAVVAMVTARMASSSVKAVVLVFLSVIAGWLTSLNATGGEFHVKAAVIGILTTFITAVAAHFGLLKPARVTGSDGVIQKSITGGIG